MQLRRNKRIQKEFQIDQGNAAFRLEVFAQNPMRYVSRKARSNGRVFKRRARFARCLSPQTGTKTMSTIHTLAADIAARVPDMARDSAVNNSGLIERLMKSHLEKMIDEIESERRKWPRRVMATNGRTVRIIYEMGL
jgi:hypothetical protein